MRYGYEIGVCLEVLGGVYERDEDFWALLRREIHLTYLFPMPNHKHGRALTRVC